MSHVIKQFIKRTPFYRPLRSFLNKLTEQHQLKRWEQQGRPVPPPAIIKRQAILDYATRYDLKIFVETGTFYGDTLEGVMGWFETLYSIELSRDLYDAAKRRFRDDPKVNLIWGDSGDQIATLMHKIDRPTLFWLDGHYSGGETARGEHDTPIYKELEHILNAPDLGHVILIDDARCFGSYEGYPTLQEIEDLIRAKRPDVSISVLNDSICIVLAPPRP